MLEIILTDDGSNTLFVPELGEYYHSIHGAIGESDFIFIGCGLKYSAVNPVRIFEAGFGTGLNALLSCIYAIENDRNIIYNAIEKHPVDTDILNSLNYRQLVKIEYKDLFEKIHGCDWNNTGVINKNFTLHKIKGNLVTDEIPGVYDLIYFDAFGPDKQPEIWTDDVFKKISQATAVNGILITFSVKGDVKRILRKNGFSVRRLPGPPGKRHILRAVKI
jgi:tRNA U34 5-methylaminomethyl-2-thiouridine-forming methyltransferase MnmC